ncbi:BON domain-containing protein [Ignatzschineria rhizosphaerae]|uniref:BON domain-containing protein n=1 Tax=Ignatzschineria rhizosphaerae TaxID=2923279 RepID=A0ABY3WZ71_9GAMM|nr:BON domain-containing protein [Ignatzschineria rhizosphaerae]UNM95330.1 BON domain-containing protein [Ignatzschineria rhizosphaerae]
MLKRFLLLSSFMVVLAGCVPAILAGGVGATAAGVNDRRTAGQIVEDNAITVKVQNKIGQMPGRNKAHISILSYNGKVLLLGEVPTQALGLEVEDVAAKTEHVKSVHNELIIAPEASLASITSDTMITAKVKSALATGITLKGFNAGNVKVETSNRKVYLMGIVNEAEAREAINIVRHVSGVEEVVPFFDIVNRQFYNIN